MQESNLDVILRLVWGHIGFLVVGYVHCKAWVVQLTCWKFFFHSMQHCSCFYRRFRGLALQLDSFYCQYYSLLLVFEMAHWGSSVPLSFSPSPSSPKRTTDTPDQNLFPKTHKSSPFLADSHWARSQVHSSTSFPSHLPTAPWSSADQHTFLSHTHHHENSSMLVLVRSSPQWKDQNGTHHSQIWW